MLVEKPEGKRPLGRPRRRWVDNIRMDLLEEGCGYMDCIGLAQDRDRWRTLVSAVMNHRAPWNAGNFLTSCKPVSCSRRSLHHGVSCCYYYYYYYYYCCCCCCCWSEIKIFHKDVFVTQEVKDEVRPTTDHDVPGGGGGTGSGLLSNLVATWG